MLRIIPTLQDFTFFSLAKISTKQCSLCARCYYRTGPGTVQIRYKSEVYEATRSERADRIRIPIAYETETGSENFDS